MGFKNIYAAELLELRKDSEDLILIDVRTPQEIASGKIENALEIDFFAPDFSSRLLELNPEKSYLIYCRSGARSAQAADFMVKNGFDQVSNLLGGFLEWSQHNKI